MDLDLDSLNPFQSHCNFSLNARIYAPSSGNAQSLIRRRNERAGHANGALFELWINWQTSLVAFKYPRDPANYLADSMPRFAFVAPRTQPPRPSPAQDKLSFAPRVLLNPWGRNISCSVRGRRRCSSYSSKSSGSRGVSDAPSILSRLRSRFLPFAVDDTDE